MTADAADQNASTQPTFEFLSPEKVLPLNHRQRVVYASKRESFVQYLRTEGKDPVKEIGYSEGAVRSMARRVHQVYEWFWQDEITTELTPKHADTFVDALRKDEFRTNDGDRYDGDSKRKFADALSVWFAWEGTDWETDVRFVSEGPRDGSDPFTKGELDDLWQAALEYKTIPNYNNLSPTERDRWRASLAQDLGKPKSEVTPDDWKKRNRSWKIPSMIRTEREAAWRSMMMARLEVDWYDEESNSIHIPAGQAIKNDDSWVQQLSEQAASTLDKWLQQRQNIEKYDGRSELWLNREGNPYTSTTLNNLLDNLMDEANINEGSRTLNWHSFRHSLGTYTYKKSKDLKLVAEMLRQKSKSSAEHYVHVPEEMKREVAESM